MVSVSPEMMVDKQFRSVAPTLFAVPGLPLYSAPAATDDYLRWAFRMMEAGADAVYCAAAFQTVERSGVGCLRFLELFGASSGPGPEVPGSAPKERDLRMVFGRPVTTLVPRAVSQIVHRKHLSSGIFVDMMEWLNQSEIKRIIYFVSFVS